ncbi:MAG: Fe-S protein assembly co-chaperone HscB [Bryobacterales bacterium]|nr:Fe-S protein assembly co-chaperone HscB [Bryobacterales bacterium]
MDYFQIFEITPQLSLNAADLQRRFYSLSRKYHPDLNPEGLEKSALLNDAFRTLRDPVARAEYVVEKNGLELNTRDVPPELLEEVFEFNMALEESDQAQLAEFSKRFHAMLREIDSELDTEFLAWDQAQSQDVLTRVRSLLNRRKYIANLVRTINQALNGHLSN